MERDATRRGSLHGHMVRWHVTRTERQTQATKRAESHHPDRTMRFTKSHSNLLAASHVSLVKNDEYGTLHALGTAHERNGT